MSTESASSGVTATPVASSSKSSKTFPTPSFVSPEPAASASKAQMQHTLSAGLKKQKRKLDGELQRAAAGETPTSGLARKKHKLARASSASSAQLTPQLKLKTQLAAAARAASSGGGAVEKKAAKKPLQDISNSRPAERKSDVPTRKLDFTPTPVKAPGATKKQRRRPGDAGVANSASEVESPSESSDSSSDDGGYSSDEAEVALDAVTLGNTRVVREGESPFSSPSASLLRPAGLEFRFSVSSTVSSIAVAPSGQFLVVGFYNGTIYLYPLTKDSLRFRRGVLLDHITARGMYTQLMVRVALPADGRFIFAGVYRGSTEIRAFEVASITFPSSSSDLARASAKDSEDEDGGDFGVPHAHAVAHTYSDPKLKGFGAVKSVFRSKTSATEYHLLCGLGIKNVHLWRFFQPPGTPEWRWECVFDKQANGISLEYLSFHPSEPDQIISKSEHQNLRVWTLAEELHDDDFTSVTLAKTAHVDVKNTADATAVFGDYAYGGSEALALIDLRSASRMELDLPLSTTEQQAQREAVAASHKSSARITASIRQRNSRRRGATAGVEELGGMRHMRTVSQVAGRESSPFTVGMCSDGSVFLHQPERVLGMATPLEYVEGYERFFQDPSLSFQAQFSDLTRVNTSGLLSVLPLPAAEKEDWMVVAANQDQLLVRSLRAFLSRNQQAAEASRARRGGAASSESSSGSDNNSSSDSSSDSEGELAIVLSGNKPVIKAVAKPAAKEKSKPAPQAAAPTVDKKHARGDGSAREAAKSAVATDAKVDGSANDRKAAISSLDVLSEQAVRSAPLVVTTPKRSTSNNPMTPYHSVASPVVSVTSLSSGASNPNTPEAHAKLSQRAKQLLVLQDLEWTPPPKAAKQPREDAAAAVVAAGAAKSSKSRSKTLFSDADTPAIDDGDDESSAAKPSANKVAERSSVTSNAPTRHASGGSAVRAEAATLSTTKAVAAKKKRGDSSRRVVVVEREEREDEEEGAAAANDVEMAASDEDDVDDELERLEATEPAFVTTPLLSDDGSLLSASLFQFQSPDASRASSGAAAAAGEESDARVVDEQAALLLQFMEQNERLQRNFFAEKARVFQLHDCACASSSSASSSASTLKRKSGSADMGGKKANWKKALSSDFIKRKQLKRRQKKLVALKLRALHASYRAQIRELLAVQKLQANALAARHTFNRLYKQLRRQEEADKAAAEDDDDAASSSRVLLSAPSSSSCSAASAPAPTAPVPAMLAPPPPLSICFPHLRLLASLSSPSPSS